MTDAVSDQAAADPDQIRPPKLSDAKLIAIDALLTGATHREAAEAAGVQRSTVTGWFNNHIGFITELDERRQQRSRAVGDLLDEAVTSALQLVATRIGEGDGAAAIALLRIVDKARLQSTRSGRSASLLATTSRLTTAVEQELMCDAMLPEYLVQLVEQRSADCE